MTVEQHRLGHPPSAPCSRTRAPGEGVKMCVRGHVFIGCAGVKSIRVCVRAHAGACVRVHVRVCVCVRLMAEV